MLEYDMKNGGLYRRENILHSINENKNLFYEGGKSV